MQKTVIQNCTVYHGDCLEMLAEIAPGSIDLCWTDPPFGISYVPNSRKVLEIPEMLANDDKPRLDFVPPIVKTVKNGGAIFHIPIRDFAGLVVGQAIRPNLFRREIDGDVNRDFLQTELECRLVSGMPRDDHAVGIDDDRLAETKLLQAGGDRIDGFVIDPGIPLVRLDRGNVPNLDVHDRDAGRNGGIGHKNLVKVCYGILNERNYRIRSATMAASERDSNSASRVIISRKARS